FLPGVYDAGARTWRVRALDAHAWVEVYFAGLGWVAFDPTPKHQDALAQTGDAASSAKAALAAPRGGRAGARAEATARAGGEQRAARGRGGVSPAIVIAAAI